MSDDGLYGAYARNAYINVLDQQNASLQEWMDSHQRWMAKAKQLEARVNELEEQKQHNLYHLGGALGTASEEGMRKNALYIYLKTINQALKAHFGDNAKQITSILSMDDPRFMNLLEHNLREARDAGYVVGKFVTDTKGILNKIPAVKKGYQSAVALYHDANGKKVSSLSVLEPVDASIGIEFSDKAASDFLSRAAKLASE